MKYEKLAESILALLNGMDVQYKMYKGNDGKRTSNPYDARYFYVSDPNLMFIIDEPTNTLSVHKAAMKFSEFKPILQSIREISRRYFINLETRDYNKSFSPRDFSPVLMKKERRVDQINEAQLLNRIETYHAHGNILEIIESGERIEFILNGEESVHMPYRKDEVVPMIRESILRNGIIDKTSIVKTYRLHEQFRRIERKKSLNTATKSERAFLDDFQHIFR